MFVTRNTLEAEDINFLFEERLGAEHYFFDQEALCWPIFFKNSLGIYNCQFSIWASFPDFPDLMIREQTSEGEIVDREPNEGFRVLNQALDDYGILFCYISNQRLVIKDLQSKRWWNLELSYESDNNPCHVIITPNYKYPTLKPELDVRYGEQQESNSPTIVTPKSNGKKKRLPSPVGARNSHKNHIANKWAYIDDIDQVCIHDKHYLL